MDDNKKKINSTVIFGIVVIILFIIATAMVTYAFFNYTSIGDVNTLGTGEVNFNFVDTSNIEIGNAFPIDQSEVDNTYESTFTITAHSTLSKGVKYSIYAVPGDTVSDRTRLLDSVMSLQFTAADDGDGFTTMINNYSEAKSPVFVDGRALISTGLVKDTSDLTTKSYKVTMFIDSDKIFVSSTVKRVNNAEGNPSLADTSTGRVTAGRYIKNDNDLVSTTLYPANSDQEGKIIYTTNEFSNSYYSIKIAVEANDATEYETVYFDANGGSVNNDTMQVKVGETYGILPTPQRDGYSFQGWKAIQTLSGSYWEQGSIDTTGNSSTSDIRLRLKQGNLVINSNTVYLLSIDNSAEYEVKMIDYFDSNGDFLSYVEPSNATFDDVNLKYSLSFTSPVGASSAILTLGKRTDGNITLNDIDNLLITMSSSVSSSTTVTQDTDHVLTASWQENS